MNKEQYLAKRTQLMNEAQELINSGKAEGAQAKMNEVAVLDEQWEAIAQATANFNALNKEPQTAVPFTMNDVVGFEKKEEDALGSEEYKNAWAKTLLGQQLSTSENKIFKMVNEAFTHTTDNTSIAIPKSVTRGIWELAGEMYPYFADVSKTYVNGTLSMIQEDTSSDSIWYEESKDTEDGKEELKEFTLNGCELSRAITVSWKLKEMSIEEFIPYIQRKMAKKMGAGAGYGSTHGAGPNKDTGKNEPTGVVTALKAEEGTPQVVKYAKGTVPTYANVLAARACVKSGYANSINIYANSTTIWGKVAAIVDNNKRPLFVPDPTKAGEFRVLGMVVKEDDSMKDGEILLSNAEDGYHMNINKDMSMMTEDHVKARKTDYCGYAIMDGNVKTTKAHALLCEADT